MKNLLSKLPVRIKGRSTFLLAIAAFAFASFAPVLPAADLARTYVASYTPTTTTTTPATVAASGTDTSSSEIIDVRRHDTVAFSISGSLMATNPAAATLTIPVYRSVDGTVFDSTATTSFVLTFTGTQTKAWTTNMTVGAFGYLRLGGGSGIVNTGTNAATNIVIKFVGKPPWALTYPSAGP